MRLAFLPLMIIVGVGLVVGAVLVPVSWEVRMAVVAGVTLSIVGVAVWARAAPDSALT